MTNQRGQVKLPKGTAGVDKPGELKRALKRKTTVRLGGHTGKGK